MSKPPIFKPVGQITRKQPGGPQFRWAVLTFLVLHVLFFSGLLLQGCRPKTERASTPLSTNGLPSFDALYEVTPPPPPTHTVESHATTELPPPEPPPESPPLATNEVAISKTEANLPIETNVNEAATTEKPTPGTTVEESQNLAQAQEYVVQAGDTFWDLAQKFSITVQALQEANSSVDPDKLQIGMTLIIPPPTPKPPPVVEESYNGTIYTIKKGDTLNKIARRFNVTVKAIQKENKLNTTKIYAGKKLKIPAAPNAQ
jgi:LysM repeat protein